MWPNILRTTSSHEENESRSDSPASQRDAGCGRRWSVLVQRFTGTGVNVSALHGCEVQWTMGDAGPEMTELPGSQFSLDVDLVLLAMGFEHVVHRGLVEALGVALDPSGNLEVGPDFMTSEPGVFAAGDSSAGASLVVHAIQAGRMAAASIDSWLAREER